MSDVVQHPTKTMIVVGARGAGKATLIGNLMYKVSQQYATPRSG